MTCRCEPCQGERERIRIMDTEAQRHDTRAEGFRRMAADHRARLADQQRAHEKGYADAQDMGSWDMEAAHDAAERGVRG